MHLSLPKRFPLFILASSVCMSLQCLISALTQGGRGGHLFRLTCSVVLWGGRNTAKKYHWRVWGVLAVSGSYWVAPAHSVCAFLVYTAQAPGCSAGKLSKVGPGLHALPRSMPLRFRLSGTPQWHRLRWACLSSSGDQVLGEHTLPRWGGVSYHLPHPSCSVSWVLSGSIISGVPCVSGELISGCDPPGGCQPCRIPGRLV